mmetsp:Transcript_6177/g.21959  ORF Transcript_6177/g.21959 Transcript_6177/m.21959 type:complete len:299 (-) Transcript_6177:2763-3659(-)
MRLQVEQEHRAVENGGHHHDLLLERRRPRSCRLGHLDRVVLRLALLHLPLRLAGASGRSLARLLQSLQALVHLVSFTFQPATHLAQDARVHHEQLGVLRIRGWREDTSLEVRRRGHPVSRELLRGVEQASLLEQRCRDVLQRLGNRRSLAKAIETPNLGVTRNAVLEKRKQRGTGRVVAALQDLAQKSLVGLRGQRVATARGRGSGAVIIGTTCTTRRRSGRVRSGLQSASKKRRLEPARMRRLRRRRRLAGNRRTAARSNCGLEQPTQTTLPRLWRLTRQEHRPDEHSEAPGRPKRL